MKLYFIPLMLLLSLTLVSAAYSFNVEINKPYNLKIPCVDSNGTICPNTVLCSLTLIHNNDDLVKNATMTWNYNYYNYTINETYLTNLGTTEGIVNCNNGFTRFNILVTNTGEDPATDIFTIFIYILFIIVVLGIFYTLFLTIAKLVTYEETIYDVLIAWAFYLLLIVVWYLSKVYLLNTFIYTLTDNFMVALVFSNGVLPLISFIITFFVKGTMKKNVLSPQEVGGFR